MTGGRGGGGEGHDSGAGATGSLSDAQAFPFRDTAHEGLASSETTTRTTARQNKRELPLDGHGTLLCSPPLPSPQQQDQESRDSSTSTSPARSYRRSRPETSDDQRMSPPLAHVSVSWGQGPEEEEEVPIDEGGVSPSTAGRAPEIAVPSYTRGGREPEAFQGDLEAEYRDVVADIEGLGGGASGGGGLAYEPLSKGPDYRKVCVCAC